MTFVSHVKLSKNDSLEINNLGQTSTQSLIR
jgi:hypothetical protein